jgi:hypothetical protein
MAGTWPMQGFSEHIFLYPVDFMPGKLLLTTRLSLTGIFVSWTAVGFTGI